MVEGDRRGEGPDAALVFYLSKADPLLVLRDLLGHSTVLTTEKYLRRTGHHPDLPGGIRKRGGRSRHGRRRAGRTGGRGRSSATATPPGRGVLMPAIIVEEPLGIRCVFSDGSSAELRLDELPNPRLARDLAAGLVELIHPHGSVDSAGTVDHYVRVSADDGTGPR